ncbi:MAG: cupredoxin domain-containing protein [Anaerolineales bacterium]
MNSKPVRLLVIGLTACLILTACGGGGSQQTQSVTIQGADIKYDITALTGKVGQPIKVTLQNTGALEHSFVIDELNVKIEGVQAGQSGEATFTPQSAGTYEYYCNVVGHKEAGMTGTLTVSQ